jgi:hypothetical protein
MMTDHARRTFALSIVAVAALIAADTAIAEMPKEGPAGKPILTITGKIGAGNGSVQFDRESLERLGLASLETKTPWHNGTVKFEGVRLDRLMKQVGAKGERVLAIALNDYSSEIPMEDFEKYEVILALKRDGEYMPVRDKGPLFVVYPYDSNPELKSQKFYSRSVWQVKSLVVK